MMTVPTATNPVSYLRDELERQKALFDAQPAIVQRFLEAQAQRLADACLGNASQVRFTLPDRVVGKVPQNGEMAQMLIPAGMREQVVGGWKKVFQRQDSRDQLRQRLNFLEQSSDQTIITSAALLRYTTAVHLVYRMLPAGRSITYRAEDGEQIPTIPVGDGAKGSAITALTDAVSGEDESDDGRGELQVPYAPAARRFYIPQWVALDDDGRLLGHSAAEAETCLASMQRYVLILHKAVALATYMAADDEYQRKRYGMLGQLIHQGRALARYQAGEIVRTIKERVDTGKLNRGLSISLPYFDDQELKMGLLDFEVIPGGRIMFKPIFVVRAARLEAAKVAQDTRLSPSTRKYLLCELKMFEQAF
ncbi:MAG: hypothetical protein WA821_07790 [Anaerolineales bacterium]